MIRPLEQRDRDAYLAMAHDFYHSSAVDHPVPDAYLERTFDALMAGTPYAACYVFEEDGALLGYALLMTVMKFLAIGAWVAITAGV